MNPTPFLRSMLAGAALAALAACGGQESATTDSAAAAAAPDSAGLTTTPPQPQGPMNMIDSGTKAPTTGDSMPPMPPDSAHPDSLARRP